MLKDYTEKYYFDQNYNCAETLLHAANEYYGLGLEEREMKLVAGFGGGMQTGNICGTVLSAISIFSMKYVETRAHESEDIKPLTQLFLRRFREALNGSLLCKDLKAAYFQPQTRCYTTVQAACDVLEEVLKEYEEKKKQ